MKIIYRLFPLCLIMAFSCCDEKANAGSGNGTVKLTATLTYTVGGVSNPASGSEMFLFKVSDDDADAEWTLDKVTNSYRKGGGTEVRPTYVMRADNGGRIELSIPDNSSYKYACKFAVDPVHWAEGRFRANGEPVIIGENAEKPAVQMYYQYTKEGNGAGQGVMMVYVEMSGNIYLGHRIARFIDMSDAVYIDYFRYSGSHLYTFGGGTMTKGIVVLTDPENEFVYKRSDGRIDASGGYHGDEQMTSIHFFADGADITDLDRDTALTPCTSFYYTEESTMHEAPKGTVAAPQPVAGHPVDCDHSKRTDICDFGYKTRNRVTWRRDTPLEVVFGGLCCTSHNLTKYARTDKDMTQWRDLDSYDNTLLGGKGFREYYAYNPTTGLSVFCTSRVTGESGAFRDSEQQLYIRDNDNPTFYKKYYRASYPINAVAGETWETEMRIEIKLNEIPENYQ